LLNLKHEWEFILDRDFIAIHSDYYMISHIAKLVNEGFFAEGGRIRGVPVSIGGSSYVPPLPIEVDVKEQIRRITEQADDAINIAIWLCLYCMKTQIFLDGNKRAAVIFANHYLIAHGGGFLVIPESHVPEFKRLLVKYYEGEDISVIAAFLKKNCWKRTQP
ncbi:MAG: Fic family protein, partial [Lachnospiraceae bacterium]|nr:Fic family protein [Lachnospiraceae bacterium]